ncbi:MAG: DNA/RNA nuclease SfsA [Magnetospiraceae bacterium]
MEFATPLIPGTLIKRYKRFLADVTLQDGTVVTAHCANSGSMLGVKTEGAPVWLSPSDNPKRKLKYTWELIEIDGALVGINTSHPNAIVAEAIQAGSIAPLAGYAALRREVKYGKNSRIDILLEDAARPPCYVEVKNVTLRRENRAEFPDAVTSRGTKHLRELMEMVRGGSRAVMVYLVQREDCQSFTPAADIDPEYAATLRLAATSGVETLCYACTVTPQAVTVTGTLPIDL